MTRIDNPIISFSEEDACRLNQLHDDALVVSIRMGDYNTHRVLVDNGSSADILYYPAFQQMQINKEHLVPTNAPLVGFGGTKVYPLSAVTLPVTVGDYPQKIIKDVTFLVVDWSSTYNAIIGRPTLNSWKAITSTSCTRMLYCDVGNGRPSTNHGHKRTVNGGGTRRKARGDTPRQL